MTTECSACSKEPTKNINVARFIAKIDECFAKNDLLGAEKIIDFWENEARCCGDKKGLLSVLNEKIGLYRSLQKVDIAIKTNEEIIELLQEEEANFAIATIYINVATTYREFGKFEFSLLYFEKAEAIFKKFGKEDTYEYATLLNNKSSLYCVMKLFFEGKECLDKAISILQGKNHNAEIALSYVNMAHLYFECDDTSFCEVERCLDLAWEYVNSHENRDANYALILKKLAPSFIYFKRPIEGEALEMTAKEIYGERV